jgi:hypothetical protein
MASDPCKDCKSHSGIEEALDNIKIWEKEAKETLKHIVTGRSAWAFFVVFLSVCLAVVGFLWHGQVAIWNNVNLNHKQTMNAITDIKEKVIVIDYKVQKHLDETNGKKEVIKK